MNPEDAQKDRGGSARLLELMQPRLTRLSAGCRRVLAAASVLGRELDLEVLRRTAGVPGGELAGALEEAAAAGMLGAVPEAPGRVRLTHDLVRQALYEAIPHGRRGRLHRRAGEAIERVHRGDRRGHLADLARHFAEGVPPDPERVVGYAREAGDRAMAELAFEEGERLYRLALSALGGLEDGERWDGMRADLLRSLARSRSRRTIPAGGEHDQPHLLDCDPKRHAPGMRSPHREGERKGGPNGSDR